jgi:hypothetical protein
MSQRAIRVSEELANQLSASSMPCPFGDGYHPSGYLCASHKKTHMEIIVHESNKSTGLYLMRGSKEYLGAELNFGSYRLSNYSYQYWLAEKMGIRLAKWMHRTGGRVFASKFSSPKQKWTALDMHMCKRKVLDEVSRGFFQEGNKLGMTSPEEGWLVNGPLLVALTSEGVVAAYDPENKMPRELIHRFMESIALEKMQ